mmetsp:Transcript_28806/g.89010  ORF Transcript_28806/g.89010 Transcript_28806/m.89010 type:complete len:862 (-) Transcript_28806:175-2760(-)
MHGLIPRAVNYLFSNLRSASDVDAEVKVSFLEVYCDTLRDLGKASLSTTKRLSMSHGPSTAKTSAIYQGAAKQREETFGLGMRSSVSGGNGSKPGPSSVSITTSQQPAAAGGVDDAHEKTKGHWYELKEEIREDKDGTVFVKGLAKLPVKDSQEVLQIIDRGLRLRATESTSMNDTSSRSHTVFTIEVTTKKKGEDHILAGKLHLVDLAGSERLKKSESSGIRMEEALHINKSLTALGKVIVSLDPAEANAHIPYRDSKLTRLLQNALGGDSYTSVLATIRPTRSHAEECLSTLQFANRCRKVANNPRVHRVGETDAQNNKSRDDLIARLRAEIERLKEFTRKLKQRITQITGLNVEEMASSELGGVDLTVPARSHDPVQTQAAVSGAVMAALRAVGVTGAAIDDSTGGVRLSDGRLLEGTLPGAFLGYQREASQRRQSRSSQFRRGSALMNTIATRVATAMGYSSPQDVPEALMTALAEREDEFQRLRRKFQSAQGEVDELHKQIDLGKRQIMSATLGAQRIESDSKRKVMSVTKQMGEQICALEHQHAQQLLALVQENNQIIEKIKPGREHSTEQVDKPRIIKSIADMELSRKMAAARDAVQRAEGRATGSEASIANLKQQYEYWLERKDRDAVRFISQLNVYRTKKNAQIEMANGELVRLWDAVQYHKLVLSRIRQGKYPIQQLRSNVAVPTIPASDLPPPVEQLVLDRLPATRRAMLKTKHEGLRRKRSKQKQDADADFLTKASGLEITPSGPPLRIFLGDAENSENAEVVKLKEELTCTKLKLSNYEMHLNQKVQESIAAELTAHATVHYMSDLETSKTAANAKASEHARRYAQLRVAYEAQQRYFTKFAGPMMQP